MFAEIGYNFVAQAPPITTFGAGAQNAPPYFGFVLHRILFPFANGKTFLFCYDSLMGNRYVLYARKSWESEERQALSIETPAIARRSRDNCRVVDRLFVLKPPDYEPGM